MIEYNQTHRPNGAAAEGEQPKCVSDYILSLMFMHIPYIFLIMYIFHIYFLNMLHIFSLGCFLMENNVFWTPQRKTMQNHYEITSKSQFWTPNVRNWTKSRELENVYVYRSWLCLGISLDLYTLRFPCVFAVRV